jgi:hypothetical protein
MRMWVGDTFFTMYGFYNRGAVATGAALRGGFSFSCFVSLSFRFVFALCGSTSLSLFAVVIAVVIARHHRTFV